MSAILISSILIRLAAFGAAMLFLLRWRDWRLMFLTLMLGLMGLRQILTLARRGDFSGISFTAATEELSSLIVSIFALAAIYFLHQIFRDQKNNLAAHELAQTQLTAVLNHTADAIIVIDERGKILTFNQSAQLLFGYCREEVQGQNVRVLMPEPHRKNHDGYLDNYLSSGKGRILGIGPRELIALRKDGEEIQIELAVSEMNVGENRRFIGTIRDISLRKANESRLRQAERLEVLGKLTGGIAHDFNNLIQVIIGNLEMLGEHLDAGSTERKLQEVALRASFRGADLTQRLLAYSRRQALKPQLTDLNLLVPHTTEFIMSTLGEDIAVETVLGGGLWQIFVDETQLETALLNLAVNARDAMPEGGKLTIETLNVRLDEEYSNTRLEVPPGQYVMLAVSDTGTGMLPHVVKSAFDPFFTTKDVGKGSGLGLSMVFGFVKQSAGHAEIYSEVGEGTTIKLYLPRHRESGLTAPVQQVNNAMPKGKETILVVEDELEVRDLVVSLLEALGYNVLWAEDGPTAVALMEQSATIDLLFSDVVLPKGMSGRDVASEFEKRFPDGAILFTSGYTETAIVHHGRLDDGVHLLGKPFTRLALAQNVRKALERTNRGQ